MENTTYKRHRSSSIFLELFEELTIANTKIGYLQFMNDNFDVKRLDEAFTRAEVTNVFFLCRDKEKTIDMVCSEYILGGTNVLFAAGQVSSRDDLSSKEGHCLTYESIKQALHILTKFGTARIHGIYYFFVHPDVKEKIDNSKQLTMIFKNCGIQIIELEFLPTFKNTKEETVYGSILMGDFAFGMTYDKTTSSLAYKRISENHMIRIETVA